MAGFVTDVGFDDFPNAADESGEVWTRFGVTYQYTYAFVDDAGTVELVTGPLDEVVALVVLPGAAELVRRSRARAGRRAEVR
jgi:hypothetical protein